MIKKNFRIKITYRQRGRGTDSERGTSNVPIVFHFRFIMFPLDLFVYMK